MFDAMERAVSRLKARCDYLEVRIETAQSTGVVVKKGEVESIRETISRGGCARAYYKGGIGFACFNDMDRLPEFAEMAVSQARIVGTGRTLLAPVEPVKADVKADISRDPRDIPISKKVDILKNYSDLALSFDPRIKETSMSCSDSFKTVCFLNSEGTRVRQEKLDIGGGLAAIAVAGDQSQVGHVGFGSSRGFECVAGHEARLAEECRYAVELLSAPGIKGGKYTVIADQHLAGVFVHEAFGHMSEGEKVAENPKMLEVMRIGKKFGGDILNIFDTGGTRGTRGFITFDDEGVPAGRTELIVAGRLAGRLHTRETAAKVGDKPTGSARAVGYSFPPIPRMRNTCISPGSSTLEEMLDGLKTGVYAVNARGGQAGEMFTFTPGRAFMIEDGRIGRLVRNATISGNLFTTLANIDMIGSDFVQIDGGGGCGKGAPGGFQFPLPVSDGAPHIRIRDLVIGGQ